MIILVRQGVTCKRAWKPPYHLCWPNQIVKLKKTNACTFKDLDMSIHVDVLILRGTGINFNAYNFSCRWRHWETLKMVKNE